MYLRKIQKREKSSSSLAYKAETFLSQQHFLKLRVHPHHRLHKKRESAKIITFPANIAKHLQDWKKEWHPVLSEEVQAFPAHLVRWKPHGEGVQKVWTIKNVFSKQSMPKSLKLLFRIKKYFNTVTEIINNFL